MTGKQQDSVASLSKEKEKMVRFTFRDEELFSKLLFTIQ